MRFNIVPNRAQQMRTKIGHYLYRIIVLTIAIELCILAFMGIKALSDYTKPTASVSKFVELKPISLHPFSASEVHEEFAKREAEALDRALGNSALHQRMQTIYKHLSPPIDTPLIMERASRKYKIDAQLLMSICVVESQLRPEVRSHANAIGMCQIIPKWHNTTEEDMYDYEKNIFKSAEIIAFLFDKCNNDRSCVIQSYNVGLYGYKAGSRANVYQTKVLREYNK